MPRATPWLAIPLFAPALVFALAHCVGDEPAFPEVDASSSNEGAAPDAVAATDGPPAIDDAGASDATADTSICNLAYGFGTPENVSELNGPTDDESGRLTPEQLTIYYSRRAGPKPDEGGLTVLSASRPSLDASFAAITPLSLGVDPSGPTITADRSTLYYSAGDGDAGPDLVVATLPFSVATSKSAAKLNSSTWDYTPYVRPDNLEIYFASRRLGAATGDDLFVSSRANGDFVTPVAITALNSASNERAPVITQSGLTLFFASDRSGNFEIYYSNRTSVTQPFGVAMLVKELAGTSQDMPDWISPDGCTLYFRSDRAGGKGGKDVWRATRLKTL